MPTPNCFIAPSHNTYNLQQFSDTIDKRGNIYNEGRNIICRSMKYEQFLLERKCL